LQELRAARLQAVRLAAIGLLQPVLDVQLAYAIEDRIREIDHDFDPLRDPELEALDRTERREEQPPFSGNLRHRVGATALGGEEELVDARVRRVQKPEAVLAAIDVLERLDRTVDQEPVADEAVVIERIEPERSVTVEPLVLEDERNVESLTRK